MYFYLSFLRPPPTAAASAVTITPQIANDLRTELKEDKPTEIYYTWQHAAYTSPPTKLTTYKPPVNTYKPVSIPLPPQAKPGQCWRLGLFAPPARGVLGRLDSLAAHVCGVWSDGITILGSPNGGKNDKQAAAAGKQTRVFREWQLGLKGDVHCAQTLRIVEQTSFDLDKKIWDSESALPLIDENTVLNAHLWTLPAQTEPPEDEREGEMTSPTNDGANADAVVAPNIEIHSKVLDWDDVLPAWVYRNTDGGPAVDVDLVMQVAADVTYNTASFPALVKTLRSLLQPTGTTTPPPLFLLAYKERDASERDLWAMARQEGIWLDKVDVIPGHEQGAGEERGEESRPGATEIWIGGMGDRALAR
ncbi:hypothetical protein QFC19_009021 [Naganishia cerealis]|uniref:Uncharacterized protein n=1 Tax=Naganishia cerealis TaxID=610337 RepID=A0ACC2UYF8_9TREE|nr:hypothetical protein QFC19_009021 [Naganishia cerealis]